LKDRARENLIDYLKTYYREDFPMPIAMNSMRVTDQEIVQHSRAF